MEWCKKEIWNHWQRRGLLYNRRAMVYNPIIHYHNALSPICNTDRNRKKKGFAL